MAAVATQPPTPAATFAGGIIDVLLADDHPIVRAGVASVLTADANMRVVAQAESGEEALTLAKRLHPRVLVIDVRLPGVDGIDVCAHLAETDPAIRVIILTQFSHESVMLRAFDVGAKGFVVKESEPELLRDAIRTVAAGHMFVDPAVASKLVDFATKGRKARGPYGLTLQEMRVLELLPKGLTNVEIAGELDVSSETVKTHLRHAMRKMQVNDRAEAAALAIREGLA